MPEPAWRHEGIEPDYRFTLANERTFLAWIRTALALLAGGVLLHQFATELGPRLAVTVLSVGLGVVAAVLSAVSYTRWRGNEIAIRQGRPAAVQLDPPGARGRLPPDQCGARGAAHRHMIGASAS